MFKKLAGVTAVAAVLIASVAIAFAGGNGKLPTKVESFTPKEAHPVDAPSVQSRATGVARGAQGTVIRYFETDPFAVPANGRVDFFMKCPRRTGAITGYFGTDGGIVADYLASGSSVRVWNFGLLDLTGVTGQAFAGIVCFKP